MVTAISRGGEVWFPDIPPWPAPDSDNATEIATVIEAADRTVMRFRAQTSTAAFGGTAHQPVSVAPAAGPSATSAPPEPYVPEPIRPSSPGHRRRRPLLVSLAAAIAVAGVIAIVAAVVLVGNNHGESTAGATSTAPSSVVSSTPADTCAASTAGTRTIGNGAGNQTSGPDVILAFNHAYYVQRDAVAVRTFTRGNVTLEAPELQSYIDAVPLGTTYCLTIDDRGTGLFALKIAVTSPGLAPQVIPQLVQTTAADGKTWITSIRKDESTPA